MQPVWTLWTREKPISPTKNQRFLGQPASGLVTMLPELSFIPGSFPLSDIRNNWQFRDYSLAYSLVTFLNTKSSFVFENQLQGHRGY
jgi:hypothetical protein